MVVGAMTWMTVVDIDTGHCMRRRKGRERREKSIYKTQTDNVGHVDSHSDSIAITGSRDVKKEKEVCGQVFVFTCISCSTCWRREGEKDSRRCSESPRYGRKMSCGAHPPFTNNLNF